MCLTPIQLKKETFTQKLADSYHYQQVPCGRCLECLKLRVNSWYVRLMAEKKVSSSAKFITLTYDSSNIPTTDYGELTLHYRDFQLFIKRLRKKQPDTKIKYFCVGEYGSKSGRPHYHCILFNVERIEDVTEEWKHGFTHVGDVNDKSIYYTLKYALKRGLKWRKDAPRDFDPLPEKALMSKGLGESFLSDAMVKYYKDDVSRPVTMLGNKKLPLPRYYRDKLFTAKEKKLRNKKLIPFTDERLDKLASPLMPQRVKKMYKDAEKKISDSD